MSLSDENCAPVEKGQHTLAEDETKDLLTQETPGWTKKGSMIEKVLKFDNFRQAIGFVNRVAEVAESQDHHPDIFISYSKVYLSLSTHKAGGLTRNDFIMAAKIDKLTTH